MKVSFEIPEEAFKCWEEGTALPFMAVEVVAERTVMETEPFWTNEKLALGGVEYDTVKISDLCYFGHPEYHGLGGTLELLKDGKVVYNNYEECDDVHDLFNDEFLELFRDEYFSADVDIPTSVLDYHFSKVDCLVKYDATETIGGLVLRMGYNGTDH